MAPPAAASDGLPAYLALGAALLGFYLLAQGLVQLRERAREREHVTAVVLSASSPGTLVTDPTLPAGIVEVDLLAVAPELGPREPAMVHAGTQHHAWAVDAPARFVGLAPDRGHALSITGPYAAEAASFEAPTGAQGARIAVRVIPIEAPSPRFEVNKAGYTPEKVLEADLLRPDLLALRWVQGQVVISEIELPRADGALAARIRQQWKMQGSHRDPSDRKLDEAIVRVAPTTPFDAILPVVEAIEATTRELSRDGVLRTVSAFYVSVQPRRALRP